MLVTSSNSHGWGERDWVSGTDLFPGTTNNAATATRSARSAVAPSNIGGAAYPGAIENRVSSANSATPKMYHTPVITRPIRPSQGTERDSGNSNSVRRMGTAALHTA